MQFNSIYQIYIFSSLINFIFFLSSSYLLKQGIGKWILLSDISSKKFSDESGEFLLELSLSNILTIFEIDYNVQNIQTLQRNFKIETNYIQYGGFDWTLTLKPKEDEINNEEFKNLNEQTSVNVFLNRLSGHDRQVRVKYRLFLGNLIPFLYFIFIRFSHLKIVCVCVRSNFF